MTYIVPVNGDLHINSKVGLCLPLVQLDSGDYHQRSDTQKNITDCWLEHWDWVFSLKKKGDKLIPVFLGETADMDFNRRTRVISRDLNVVKEHAYKLLDPISQKADALIFLEGTAAHVGKNGWLDTLIASRYDMTVQDPETNKDSWAEFDGYFGEFLLHAKHHGPIGRLEHTRVNALHNKAVRLLARRVKEGRPYPRVSIQGHNHLYADTWDNDVVRVVANPCWCGTTPWAKSIFDERPDIGGTVILTDGKDYELITKRYPISYPRIWKI